MPDTNTYDAIVIGTGISGGWAAKELCEKGLKTLVLERGRMVRHIVSFRKVGRLYRRSEERHELWLYRAGDIAGALREAGFRVRILRGYGERRLPPAHAVAFARKLP